MGEMAIGYVDCPSPQPSRSADRPSGEGLGEGWSKGPSIMHHPMNILRRVHRLATIMHLKMHMWAC